MNKAELIEEASSKVGLTEKDAGNVVDAVVEAITGTLKKKGKGDNHSQRLLEKADDNGLSIIVQGKMNY